MLLSLAIDQDDKNPQLASSLSRLIPSSALEDSSAMGRPHPFFSEMLSNHDNLTAPLTMPKPFGSGISKDEKDRRSSKINREKP
jgi:hypothetical protein